MHYAARAGSLDIIQYFINFKKVSPFIVSDVIYLTYLNKNKKLINYFKIGATIAHDAAVKGKF